MKVIVLFSFFALSAFAEGLKILYFNPTFGKSHVTLNGKIADTLAAAGHDVVVYQPIINEKIKTTGSSHKNVRYYFKPKNESSTINMDVESRQEMIWEQSGVSKLGPMMTQLYQIKYTYCRDIMNDEENLSKLKAENFDLGISEMFESCGFGVFHAIGLKKVISVHGGSLIVAFGRILGIPAAPSIQPAIFTQFSSRMSFFQRVGNFIGCLFEVQLGGTMIFNSAENAIKEKYPDFNLMDKLQNSAFTFINTDEVIDYPAPLTSKVIYIGGLGKSKSKPLEKKYQDIFDSAKRGVIYFSFGSVAQGSSMPEASKRAFVEAFSEFPDINFIWKYEKDSKDLLKGSKNIFTFDWLPQNDILDHKKLLAFISHGGMNSVIESASKGVPMICIPIFADQPHNAKMLEVKETAVMVDKNEISKDNIVTAIKKIIENPKFKENALRISQMIEAKPMTAEERVVKYAEFAARFGDSGVFISDGIHLNFIQLYSIDVVFFLLFVITTFIYIVYRLIKKLFRSLLGSSHQKQD